MTTGIHRQGASSGAPSPWRERPGALGGLKVLDLTRILAGPFCTMILADLGADVIKVENPAGGDDTRLWGPPFIGDDAAYYHSVNRNKRDIAVDLKSPEGLDIVRRLALSADVVVENFRPGTVAKLGLSYEQLSEENPALVYASISGFGQTGPWSSQAGYDATAQALSGVMSVTGPAEGEPVRFGVSGADLGAGMWAAIGLLAALRERDTSGRGQYVDVALLDGQVAWLTYLASGFLASGDVPRRYGSAHPTIVPYQAFPTRDGDIMIAAGNDKLWQRLADTIGLPSLVHDERFARNADRVLHRDELLPRIAEALAFKTSSEWQPLLEAAGVPAAPVNSVSDALASEQVAARDMIWTLPRPEHGDVQVVGSPIKLSVTPPRAESASPTLGQHTRDILGSLGLSPDQLADLEHRGVVTTHRPAE